MGMARQMSENTERRGRGEPKAQAQGSAAKEAEAGTAGRSSRPRPSASTGGRRFYEKVLTAEERAALAELAANASLGDEIGLLRVLIRRKLDDGADLADISKAIDTLGRALKVQKQISAQGQRALQDALSAVLVELGNGGNGDTDTEGKGTDAHR